MQTVRIGAEEEVDDTKGLKPEEISKQIREKEAKAHAQILEMVSRMNTMSIIYRLLCLVVIGTAVLYRVYVWLIWLSWSACVLCILVFIE